MAAYMPRHPRGPRPLPRTSPLPTSGSGFRHRGRAIEDVDIIWDLDLYLGREMELSFSAWFRQVAASVNQTSEGLRLAKQSSISALLMASDYRFNLRNLEDRWYAFWLSEAQRLVNSIDPGRFCILPQFNLWRQNKAHKGYEEKEVKQDGSSSPMLPLEISSWIRSFTETGRDVSNQWTEQGDYVYWEDPTSALVTVDESIPQGEVAGSTHRADTFPQAGRPRRQDRSHAWDTSIQSNATAKISQDDMESQVVDFAIGFLEGLRCLIRPDENYHEQLTGMPDVDRVPRLLSHHWTADREWIPMIIEDKRLPQRARLYRSGLTTQGQVKDVLDLGMREAKKQAKKQAGYFFTGRRWNLEASRHSPHDGDSGRLVVVHRREGDTGVPVLSEGESPQRSSFQSYLVALDSIPIVHAQVRSVVLRLITLVAARRGDNPDKICTRVGALRMTRNLVTFSYFFASAFTVFWVKF
ncbi:uncharacterized protein STEHIDRAFT_109151 [Stereum hirsutum FP-91666 SS1]|uniref:uncharacterized protein n=1 Tax=Stereum hirsutum (strain FP-91666) TaxID=721885 RepID=UPI000440D2ED|nr:uncharacterized protein STEHIDRAFT_109151 [Stereum hirsutum FP-91666 SS1]EIM88815.1 hypothetical protein STEHIDRAFT_109151 [Stereum hirsutum FP-91666 SS1]